MLLGVLVKTVPRNVIKAFMISQLNFQCYTGEIRIKVTLPGSLYFASSGSQPAWWLAGQAVEYQSHCVTKSYECQAHVFSI